MIFNKQGSVMKKHQLFYKNKPVEIVKQYTYVGFTFVPSGRKQVGIDNLINKGKKLGFQFKRWL